MTPPPSTPETDPVTERLADPASSVLVVIDIQEAFRGKLHEEKRLVEASGRLLQAAGTLGVPVIVTEQYPERLGATLEEVAAFIPPDTPNLSKRTFSCLGAEGFEERLRELGRSQIVVAGVETHICVAQTAHHLMARGYQVHAVRDAITSRFALESGVGFQKMVDSGAVATCVEGVLFEWLQDSRSPHFKAVQRLVL